MTIGGRSRRRALLAVGLALIAGLPGPARSAESYRVIDGDTIGDGDTTYRLFGIDAPEAGQKCSAAGGGTWPCGKAAIALLEGLVIGHDVVCDNRGLDEYGRVLAVCHADGAELNRALVEAGLAWSFRKYAHAYDVIEDAARTKRNGVWQAATSPPWAYREARWKVAEQRASDGCPIKGNINSEGVRIYHAPWSPWYDRTKVSPDKGERWFCNEGEALAAGWRAPIWGR